MSLLDDLADEVQAYPHNYLEVEIIDVDPPGNVVNEDEEVSFRIQVSNSGPLDANDLSLLVEGLNGTEVQSNGVNLPWLDSFTISGAFCGNVLAHTANGSGPKVVPGNPFHFRQSRDFASATDLVRVSVAGFDTSFDHVTLGHSREDASAQDTYSAIVFE
jgi:hypothetical protein